MGSTSQQHLPNTIELTGNTLTLAEVGVVAYHSSVKVKLSNAAQAQVQQSRKIVEAVLASDQVSYGINTGFGSLSSVKINSADLAALQRNLVRSHAAGTGPLLDEPTVRAMILLRANTLSKGFSGVRPEVIECLLKLLNTGIYPVIPSQGSLGASGDLAPLAHLALVLMGEGEVVIDGQTVSSLSILEKFSIQPLTLQAKEGLALLNGTQMMSAIGILTLLEAEKMALLADLTGAMTIEAVKGSHQPFDARVAEARQHPGHKRSADQIRRFLANSQIAQSHQHCDKVQDAYSLRCIPQVHGAVYDSLGHIRKTLEIEANSATDNPLVFPNGDIISQGNFHGEPVAMAMDHLSIALAELASIAERRIDKLMNPVFSELPEFLVPNGKAGLHSGLMIVHYTAASLVSENKTLAHPAVVDTIPTSNDKEDHVSMGAFAARKARQILENTQWVLTAEFLCAGHALGFHQGLKPGDGVAEVLGWFNETIAPISEDRLFSKDINRLKQALQHDANFSALLGKYLYQSESE